MELKDTIELMCYREVLKRRAKIEGLDLSEIEE